MVVDKRVLAIGILFLFASLSFVSAITGSIGNARMILREDYGDVVEKYVLVKNVNNVSVDVELFVSGDLEDYVDIQDSVFSLEAGDEKKAYFNLKIGERGTTTTNINVKFTPKEGGNGVGLSSTIIVIEGAENIENNIREDDEEIDESIDDEIVTGDVIAETSEKSGGVSIGIVVVFLIIILTLIVILILLFILSKKRRTTKFKRRVRQRG